MRLLIYASGKVAFVEDESMNIVLGDDPKVDEKKLTPEEWQVMEKQAENHTVLYDHKRKEFNFIPKNSPIS